MPSNLLSSDGTEVVLRSGAYKLPFGTLNLYVNETELQWGAYRLVDFKQAAELGVRGLRNRYRWPGIGAPLAASIDPMQVLIMPPFPYGPKIKVPVTIFVRLDDVAAGITSGAIRGHLELYTTEEATAVSIEGKTRPLSLNKAQPWLTPLKAQTYINLNSRGCSP